MVDISLLPKEGQSEPKPKKSKKEEVTEIKAKGIFPTKFLIWGILIVLFSGIITFGLFIYKNARASTLRSTENQISILKSEEDKYKVMEAEAKTLQNQLNTLNNLIAKHKYWSTIITALADNTPVTVQYKKIVCEEKNNKFTISGFANNYEDLAQLMVSLKQIAEKDVVISSVELNSAKLGVDDDKKIKVDFSLSFNLKEQAFLQNSLKNQSNKDQQQESQQTQTNNQTNIIIINESSYNPTELKVKTGTEVTFKNDSPIIHSIASVNNVFPASGNIDPGKDYKITFNNPGSYKFYCPIHSNPDGKTYVTIIVE